MLAPLLLQLACAPDTTASAPVIRTDADGDGWPMGLDCDDEAWDVHPGAAETCDETDEDCDGQIDDHPVDGVGAWRDLDGDGYGDSAGWDTLCEVVAGWSTYPGDCDDGDPATSPSATETCATDADDDCDGDTNDPGAAGCETRWADADGDLAGGPDHLCLCEVELPYDATGWTDCDDRDPDRAFGCGLAGDHRLSDSPVLVTGARRSDYAGSVLFPLGDVTGDALPDLGVAPVGDDSDRVWVLAAPFDRARGLAAADAVVDPANEWDLLGATPTSDLDGDGDDEVAFAVCAPGEILGIAVADAPLAGDRALGPDDVWLYDTAPDACLASIAALDDGDGDGAGEVVVADNLAGAVWLFEPAERAVRSFADAAGIVSLVPGCPGGLATPGDLDGDGLDDLVVGDPCLVTGGLAKGAVHFVLAPVTGMEQDVEIDRTLVGEADLALAGLRLAPVGDADGDGRDDVAVAIGGDPGDDGEVGAVRVIGNPWAGDTLADAAFFSARGSGGVPPVGLAAADLDGDGVVDLAVSQPDRDVLCGDGGLAALFFGPLEGSRATDEADARWHGEGTGDAGGSGLLALEDAAADGADGLWIGAPGSDLYESDAGALWFVAGGPR